MSSGHGKLKSAILACAMEICEPGTGISCQFFMVRKCSASSCIQFSEPYIADRLEPPCMTCLPISFVAYRNGMGPEETPPVRPSVRPDGRNADTSTPIPPPVIRLVPISFHRTPHSSLVSSLALNR